MVYNFLGEIKHAFELSRPKMVIVSPIIARKAASVCRKLKYIQKIILMEGKSIDNFIISLSDLIKQHEKIKFDINERFTERIYIHDQVALIFCSSGTTGMPKQEKTFPKL